MSSFITAYCAIRKYCISSKDALVYERKGDSSFDAFLIEAYESLKISYPKFYKMDTLSKAGFMASELILKGRILKDEYSPGKIAVVLSNASASLDTDLKYEATVKTIPSPALFVYTLPNIVTGEICIRQGWKGENAFFVSDQFDPGFLSVYVEQVLSQGAEACLTGWIEVLGEQHDVFLYLVENRNRNNAVVHSVAHIEELYRKALWKN